MVFTWYTLKHIADIDTLLEDFMILNQALIKTPFAYEDLMNIHHGLLGDRVHRVLWAQGQACSVPAALAADLPGPGPSSCAVRCSAHGRLEA